MKHVYNTGKVKIGLAYEPPPQRQFSEDEERIQAALLRKDKPMWTPAFADLFFAIAMVGASCVVLLIARNILQGVTQ